jgi:uroporphyrinogen decarboxylase
MFRKYVFPWYKKHTEMVHSRGLPVLLHTCGDPSALFEDIIEAGFDALHPLQSNAVDIYEVKRLLGDRLCLCGNIDLTYEPTLGSPDEVAGDVKEHVRRLAPGGGYCLGSSNSIPNYVPLDRYLAMNRACLEFGTYPIAL